MPARSQRTLREAASTIFALTSVLPLLVFLYALWHYELLGKTAAQLGLLAALVIALLGFFLLRRMVDSIARVARMLDPNQVKEAAPEGSSFMVVPGLGQVTEVGELVQAFSRMLVELRASADRLEDLVFKLGPLNDMVEMAAGVPPVQDLLAHVLERTMRTIHASIGSIMLLDHEHQTLRLAVSRGLPADANRDVEVKLGEGVAGKVAQMGEPVLVEDIEKDPRFAKPNDPKYGGGSFICMPLRIGDRMVGVINLAKKEHAGNRLHTPPFSVADFQFLNTLMTYTAYAVNNARLLEEAQQATQQLNAVVEDQKLRLTLTQKQMIQAAKLSALGELVAGVAHELKNPLAVIVGYAELLSRNAPESMQAKLQMMQEASERARRIVEGLLTFARQMPLQRQAVSLTLLLDKVLAIAVPDLRLARVTVEQEIERDLPVVLADDCQLQQVLINLITNAKQAMTDVEGERRLKITMRRAGPERVLITVENTGPGIPPDLLPTIFDPFVSTKGANGTGLGLSISYGIIKEHGGQISAESAPGRGARFTIQLLIGTSEADASLARPEALPLQTS
jgi:two-component system NtrC family sensor kinase